jgi:hypothetical protein
MITYFFDLYLVCMHSPCWNMLKCSLSSMTVVTSTSGGFQSRFKGLQKDLMCKKVQLQHFNEENNVLFQLKSLLPSSII